MRNHGLSRLACLMVLAAGLLGCVLPQTASAEESASTSGAASSNKGLGPGTSVPSWAVGERVHFMAGQPASAGLAGEPLESSGELGRRPGTDKPLLYHGSGSGVQHSPVLYPIFWGKNWEVEPGLALKKQLTKLYEGLSTSTWQGIQTQYFDATGRVSSTVTVATPWIDTSVTAPASVNDAKLKEEVATALKAEANKSWKREFSSQFIVMPAPGSTYEAGFDTGFCAYHGVDGSGSSYTFLPYLGGEPFKSGCVNFYDPKHENADNVDSMAASHEYAESTTDAGLNSWYTKDGWEIGDLCASEGAAEEVTTGSLKGSWVQGIWDDHQSACSLEDEKPPHVYTITEAASEIKGTTARLNGTVNPEALETKYHFEYGTTTSYGSASPEVSAGSGVINQAENAILNSLKANTEYHYRLVAKNNTGTTNGEDNTFTTTTTPPSVETKTAADVMETSAALNGSVNPEGNETKYYFEYGPTKSYGTKTAEASAGAGTSSVEVSKTSTGLTADTEYHYRIVATDAEGTFYGLDEVFKTRTWSIQETPKLAFNTASLSGVSCTSTTACVAVGQFEEKAEDKVPLAEIWNGTTWTLQEPPGPTEGKWDYLHDASCTSSVACIAVGYYQSKSSENWSMLAERWNGTIWSIEEVPNPKEAKGTFADLQGVTCSSAEACIAVGWYINKSPTAAALIEHWNGKAWSVEEPPLPAGTKESTIASVSCSASAACTAIGSFKGSSGEWMPLAERWNGTTWTDQEPPKPTGSKERFLKSISCASSTACTAVGYFYNSSDEDLPFMEGWNGTTWSVQEAPSPKGLVKKSTLYLELSGVSCTSSAACIAVGGFTNSSEEQLLFDEEWDGTTWSVQEPPKPTGGEYTGLSSVSCTPSITCTAVGGYTPSPGGGEVTLAERYE